MRSRNKAQTLTPSHTAMPQVVIIGGGFAGRAAASALRGALSRSRCRLTLIDRHPFTTMVPALPDVAAERVERRYVTESLRRLLPPQTQLLQAAVTAVDLDGQCVQTQFGAQPYDYLVLSQGSEATPPDDSWPVDAAYPLATLDDAMHMRQAFSDYLKTAAKPRVVISGAGYTGIELATALAGRLRIAGQPGRITLLEKAADILPFLTAGQRRRVRRSLERQHIDLRTHCRIQSVEAQGVTLSGGECVEDVFLCRCEGLRVSFVPEGKSLVPLPHGRLPVTPSLSLTHYANTYAAGDVAALRDGEVDLRASVQNSLRSGACAGANIARALRGKPPRPFRPIDLGWVIPTGNDSVGRILGWLPVEGRCGLMLHYFMCGFRNFNFRNFAFFVRYAFKATGKEA